MSELVPAVAEALQASLDVPFAVFGHSVGALLAFEWTRQLRRLGCPGPSHLVVAARRAPHLVERRARIADLPQADFITAVRERYNGIPVEVLQNPDLLDLLVPTLRGDMQLLESYVHTNETPLDCPISCFGGREDTEATLQDLHEWRRHTTTDFSVRVFPGSHFFLQSAQATVTAAVAAIVAGASAGQRDYRGMNELSG
jgi:medium-chain acyl-[acyl-carrier-protein] hydrolase